MHRYDASTSSGFGHASATTKRSIVLYLGAYAPDTERYLPRKQYGG